MACQVGLSHPSLSQQLALARSPSTHPVNPKIKRHELFCSGIQSGGEKRRRRSREKARKKERKLITFAFENTQETILKHESERIQLACFLAEPNRTEPGRAGPRR